MKPTKPLRRRKHAPILYNSNSEKTFLSKVHSQYSKDADADEHNRDPAREDNRFVIGDQWHASDKARRERNNKPVLTVNRFPAFLAQFVGSWLQTDTTIKLTPSHGGTKLGAEMRQGLIRFIMRGSAGKHATNQAMMMAYACGIGNFSLDIVENENDVFAMDMELTPHEDPFEVIWDRGSREPTGADAGRCYVFKPMTKEVFEATWPDAAPDPGWGYDEVTSSIQTAYGWDVDEMVRVCYFWQMRSEDCTLALEADTGDVIDITDMSEDEWRMRVALDEDGEPIMRETTRPYAECTPMTRKQVLEEPIRYNSPRIPVFRVPGWVMFEGSVQHRWGFVRNAKDPQRLHNYWRSILAEELSKSVSAKWLLDSTAMKSGLADRFRYAHLSDDNVLFWDSQADGAKPERVDPPMLNQAVLTEASMTVQDMKDVTNKHEASFGIQSNEVSGKAINARQRVSELGEVIYIEHMNMALAEAGRVINAMIPEVYNTRRTIKIMGEDDREQLQVINGELGDKTPDVTTGKYDVTYTTGPSYATKREESTDVILTLMNTMPAVGNIVADILVRNMDILGAEEIEDRLGSMLPKGMIDLDRLSPTRRAKVEKRMQQQAEAEQAQKQREDIMFMAALQKTKMEVAELASRADKQGQQAHAEGMRAGIEVIDKMIEAYEAQTNRAKLYVDLDRIQADMLGKGLAAAQTDIQRAEDRADARAAEGQPAPRTTGVVDDEPTIPMSPLDTAPPLMPGPAPKTPTPDET